MEMFSRNGDKKIVIEQLPEKVISVRIKTKNMPDVMVLLGSHIIGNRHRPISIQRTKKILFPIQADSEKEYLQNYFRTLSIISK